MKLLAKIGLLGLMAGGTATALYADPVGGWLSPNGLGTTGGAAATGQTATGVTVNLSLVDLQMRVHLLHDQTRADARHVQHLQQIARREKDIIKLNCVNDKLVQLKPEMNLADTGEAELETTTETSRMAIFGGIEAAAESVRRLREEADQCIGEPVTQAGDSSNSFTAPAAPDDPTKGFGGGQIEAPGYASPFN